MKKLFILIIALLLLTACSPADDNEYASEMDEEDETEEPINTIEFLPSSPVVEFDQSILDKLNINLSGTDAEIAQGIYDWQTENMTYVALWTNI